MNDASLLYHRVDGRTKLEIDELLRDDGAWSEVAVGDVELDVGTCWRARRGRPRQRGGR